MARARPVRADSPPTPVGIASRRGPRAKSTARVGRTLARLRLVLLAALLASGCLGKTGHTYKLYPGPERPPEELAVVEFGERVTSIRIEGMRVDKGDYDRIELLPGTYQIDWRTTFSVSPMVNPQGYDKIAAMATVDLEAGHEYSVNSDRTTGPGYTMRWWLEDTTTGAVVAGSKRR